MIAPVRSAEERAALYALRYNVIVREQGYGTDPSADHARGTIIDPADDAGIVLAAWHESALIGSVRCNLLRDGPAMPCCQVLGLDTLPDNQRALLSVSSRLVVSTPWRTTPVAIRLMQAGYRCYRVAGLDWDYIVVRPEVVGFYTRLGYVPAGEAVAYPGVGQLNPLRLDLAPDYLERVQSVLVVGSAEQNKA